MDPIHPTASLILLFCGCDRYPVPTSEAAEAIQGNYDILMLVLKPGGGHGERDSPYS